MKKCDFHIHTVPTISDSAFTFSLNALKGYVEKMELDAIAITNHNVFDMSNLGPLVRLGNYIRQIASILRYTRDLINDYSELLSMTVLLESEIILNSTIKSSSESYFFQQLKTLNSSWV